jgi:hypothetical protein
MSCLFDKQRRRKLQAVNAINGREYVAVVGSYVIFDLFDRLGVSEPKLIPKIGNNLDDIFKRAIPLGGQVKWDRYAGVDSGTGATRAA